MLANTVEPVVVRPDTDSKRAFTNESKVPARTYGAVAAKKT
jgi:hypothetical protein